MKKLFSFVVALLIMATPITVMAGSSPTGTKNGGGYDGCGGDNIYLAPNGCRAFVNNQWLTSLGNGTVFTDEGNVYDANGNFLYNMKKGGSTGLVTNVASPMVFRFTRGNDATTFEDFTGVLVDDVWVDPSNYVASKGSVVITLKQAFIDKLSVGQHKLTVTFSNSESQVAYFTVSKGKSGVPNTGEKSNTPYIIMLGGALIVIAGTGYILYANKH